ncbi:hypothetical protein RF11_08743 [Thelohanellus kitauei]|uniref:Uncharacterized protein n=1 Tax=Thelohanellus kitauei TaxID=669202 RepID=A0A0C2MWV3_THEKT|nr:hypothetical protein RF11_08743 [Thelohanellus kitauei]
MFIDLISDYKNPTLFNQKLQFEEKITDLKVDKIKKCIYLHIPLGIAKKCYSNEIELKKRPEMIVEDVRIRGVKFDSTMHYLFYFDKHTISAINLKSLVKTTLYQTEDVIYFLKVYLNDKYAIKITVPFISPVSKKPQNISSLKN